MYASLISVHFFANININEIVNHVNRTILFTFFDNFKN
jgi:hypothetical protein